MGDINSAVSEKCVTCFPPRRDDPGTVAVSGLLGGFRDLWRRDQILGNRGRTLACQSGPLMHEVGPAACSNRAPDLDTAHFLLLRVQRVERQFLHRKPNELRWFSLLL